ncbi:MAG: hypothetical protein ABSG69_10650, partial [Candidatus Acidiferrum sp.]
MQRNRRMGLFLSAAALAIFLLASSEAARSQDAPGAAGADSTADLKTLAVLVRQLQSQVQTL